jgi:hypothetical protein
MELTEYHVVLNARGNQFGVVDYHDLPPYDGVDGDEHVFNLRPTQLLHVQLVMNLLDLVF